MTSTHYSTTGGWLLTLLRTLDQQGVNIDLLIRDEGLTLDAVISGAMRIDMDVMTRLWHQARLITGDPTIGLKVARNMRPTTFSSLTAALYAVPDLQTALRLMARFGNIFTDGGFWWVREMPDAMELVVLRRRAVANEVSDAVFAGILKLLQDISTPDLRPGHVHIGRERPANCAPWYTVFGDSIEFHSTNNSFMRFPRAPLETKLFGYDAAVLQHSVALMEAQLAGVRQGPTTAYVRAQILSSLGTDAEDIESVAAVMGLSPRSLQRRLGEESQTFRGLVDEVRRDTATRYLLDSVIPVTEIAARLGYGSLPSFTRACYRWHGMSPLSVRREHLHIEDAS